MRKRSPWWPNRPDRALGADAAVSADAALPLEQALLPSVWALTLAILKKTRDDQIF